MATSSAASSKHATLTPATMDTVTLTNPAKRVLIKNRSTTAGNVLYATINGADPTSGGDNTISVCAGETYMTPDGESFLAAVDVVIKLISATADPYSVMVEG